MMDYLRNYVISKNTTDEVDMAVLCNKLIYYVQHTEIYFETDVKFITGVMVFSIVGSESEHYTFEAHISDVIGPLGCKLICGEMLETIGRS